MSTLQGKVAVVTGSSRGIGEAIARRYAAEGAAVVVHYSASRERAEAVVAEIVAAGGRAVAVGGDVSDPATGERLVRAAVEGFGGLDVLVNNAGVFTPDADPEPNFRVNVLGLLAVTAAALPHLRSGASVIHLSSILGRDPMPGYAAYSASKAAVDAITRAQARELGPRGIRVNAIAPGFTDTDMTAAGGPEFRAYALAATPLGRVGEVADVAAAALYLASDAASYVTGEVLGVGGGIRL